MIDINLIGSICSIISLILGTFSISISVFSLIKVLKVSNQMNLITNNSNKISNNDSLGSTSFFSIGKNEQKNVRGSNND